MLFHPWKIIITTSTHILYECVCEFTCTHTHTHPCSYPEVLSKRAAEQLDSSKTNLRWCLPAAACTLSLALESASDQHDKAKTNLGPLKLLSAVTWLHSWDWVLQSASHLLVFESQLIYWILSFILGPICCMLCAVSWKNKKVIDVSFTLCRMRSQSQTFFWDECPKNVTSE